MKKEIMEVAKERKNVQEFIATVEREYSARPPGKYQSFNIICTNHDQTYRTGAFRIYFEKDQYEGEIEYSVMKCSADTILYYTLTPKTASISDLLIVLYQWLWTSTVCIECYELIPCTNRLCFSCSSYQIFWEIGLEIQTAMTVPMCSICFEPVFHSRLQCGHYFHKKCFIGINKQNWYHHEDDYNCPLCRQTITSRDISNFFLY
jgi:Ring finger domain